MPRTAMLLPLLLALLATGCSDGSDSFPEPFVALLQRYVLSSEVSVPEGVAFDPVDRAFYASALIGASITRVDADGTESLLREPDNRAQVAGIKVDPQARRLWACVRGVDGVDNRVWVFDLDSGEQVLEFLLGALSPDGSCNDLVLDDAGIAYVTDPANPFLYRLDGDSGEGEVLATDPLFQDVTGIGLGLNGIAVAPDGNSLVVAKFFPPSLLRVSLPDADSIAPIALSGDPLPTPDGLVELEGDIYAVADAAVARVRLNGDATAGDVVVAAQESGLSTAAVAEGAVYVIKSEVTNLVGGRTLDLPFAIFSIDLTAFGP